ncbi:MAG: hypothetical protein WEA61_05335 [Anaerolineales bacterium]
MLKNSILSLAVVLAVVMALASTSIARAGTLLDDQCFASGGTWELLTFPFVSCTYPPGSDVAVAQCGQGYSVTYTYELIGETTVDILCIQTADAPILTEDSDNPGQPATLHLGGGKNGSVTFPPGSCPQKCTISASLPAGANSSLPSGALATLYVRVVDEGGVPGTGSYTVCFDNTDGASLTIYRYIAGAWVAVSAASSNPICTTASGDGAFYLGG